MLAYSLGLSLPTTFVGFLLALGVIRLAFKMRLVKQLKIVAYVIALVSSTIIHIALSPLQDSTNVVVGTLLGFTSPLMIAWLIKTNRTPKQDEDK